MMDDRIADPDARQIDEYIQFAAFKQPPLLKEHRIESKDQYGVPFSVYYHILHGAFGEYIGNYEDNDWTMQGYTITFDPNGGTLAEASAVQTNADGKLDSMPSSPIRSGYTFDGWYTAVSNGDKVTESTVFDKDTTVYAQWTYSGGSGGSGSGGSSSSSSSSYTVSVSQAEGGTVGLSTVHAVKGDTVTITVNPKDGYVLSGLSVVDSNGNQVELAKVSNNKYTFTMPSGKVTVTPTFIESTGSDTTPETPDTTSPFTDVPSGAYYYDAIQWAVDEGITTGKTATTFDPDGSCTRAQMVTFLWRYAGEPEPESSVNPFTDIADTAYYYKAVLWAVEQGITNGTTDATFEPDKTVTRAQTVTFLYRYAGEPTVSSSNSFTDVENGKYFTNAIQWAVKNGITTGYNDGTFRPYNNCTRAQIVTFMYRDFA